MKRAEAKTRTFNQILERLETRNAERLIEKARTANRLVKSAPEARPRRSLYTFLGDFEGVSREQADAVLRLAMDSLLEHLKQA